MRFLDLKVMDIFTVKSKDIYPRLKLSDTTFLIVRGVLSVIKTIHSPDAEVHKIGEAVSQIIDRLGLVDKMWSGETTEVESALKEWYPHLDEELTVVFVALRRQNQRCVVRNHSVVPLDYVMAILTHDEDGVTGVLMSAAREEYDRTIRVEL